MKSKASLFTTRVIRLLTAALIALPLLALSAGAERVFITEFMAANTRSLLDRDREYSDWIELYNAGNDAVNLDGWRLTDDRTKLDKWRFPAVSIGPSEYLLVFASGKNRRNAGTELHTNFKLDAEGEYLGLIRPDGRTVASEFAPAFPRQSADASFGLAMSSPSVVLAGEDAPKKVLVPKGDIGMSWLIPKFDDTKWETGTKGVGYDAKGASGLASLIGVNLESQMAEQNSSAFIRVPFVITNTSVESLKLRVRYDDGFVAYLNGWEVARANAPSTLSWNAAAAPGKQRDSSMPVGQMEQFDNNSGRFWTYQLNPGTRPKEHPHVPGATDRFLRLVNGQMANQLNTAAFPSAGDAQSDTAVIELDYRFTGTGDGTERLSILLVPLSGVGGYGAEGPGVKFDTAVRDPNLGGIFAVQLLFNPEDSQCALTMHWDGAKRATVDVPSATFRQRAFHRIRIALQKAPGGVQAKVTLTPESLGNPAGPRSGNATMATALMPNMPLGGQRVQLAGRIGHWDQTIDVDNVRFQMAGAAGVFAEEFDLTGNLEALKPGPNILALHALNRSTKDTNFFVLPELLAGFGAVRTNAPLYLSEPTPAAVNRQGHPAMAPVPVFLTKGGVYKDSVRVEMAAKEGVIRYTLDGSEATASSPEYTGPISLGRTAMIRARTFLPNHAPSPPVLETFTLAEPGVAAFNSNLPIIVLNSFGRYISANNKSPVSIRFIHAPNGRTSLLGPADFDGRAMVNLRGFSTLRQPKNSLTVRFRDENGDKVKTGLFGLPKGSDWVLYAPYVDKTLIRDALAYELSNAMGRYAPRTRFVEVYIDRNGGRLSDSDYAGVYVLVERIEIDKNRLNIDPIGPDDNQDPGIAGGYLFKRDHSERYEASFRTSQGNRFFFVEPKGNEITREQSAWISRYVSQFEQSLYSADFRDPNRGYARYLDVDAFIDQHWLIETTKNIDGFRYSAYVHKPRAGKLTVGPAWDWNLSFGNANYHDGDDPRGWYTDMLRDSEICWFRRLSEDPEFMQRTIDRWTELRRTVFSTARIHRRIDEMAVELRDAQIRNFRRWPVLGRHIHPNSYVGRTYEEEIAWMKGWIGKRIDWIDSQFTKAPSVRAAGGAVTIAGSGQIYFTLDGSDPRGTGGRPSASAALYKSPVSTSANQILRARIKRGEQWSGLSSTRDKQEL